MEKVSSDVSSAAFGIHELVLGAFELSYVVCTSLAEDVVTVVTSIHFC